MIKFSARDTDRTAKSLSKILHDISLLTSGSQFQRANADFRSRESEPVSSFGPASKLRGVRAQRSRDVCGHRKRWVNHANVDEMHDGLRNHSDEEPVCDERGSQNVEKNCTRCKSWSLCRRRSCRQLWRRPRGSSPRNSRLPGAKLVNQYRCKVCYKKRRRRCGGAPHVEHSTNPVVVPGEFGPRSGVGDVDTSGMEQEWTGERR